MAIDNPNGNSGSLEQYLCEHHKAFTNYISAIAKTHSDKVFVRYYSNGEYKTLTYADVERISTNLACKLAADVQGIEVVSFISDHSVSYLIIMLALLKLRSTLLTVSPRSYEAAIVSMLEKTQSKLLIANVKYEEISKSSAAQVDGVKVIVLESLDIETLVQEPLNASFDKILDLNFTDKDIEKPAWILHSSGSTGIPKPIYLSNRYVLRLSRTLPIVTHTEGAEGVDYFTEKDTIICLVPLFHGMGVLACFSMAAVGGSVVIPERLPPSQEELNHALKVNKVTVMSTPPIILEQMIPYLTEKNDFSIADHLRLVLFGGAPLKQECGEWFHSHGVNVRSGYGITEVGFVMCSDISSKNTPWNTLRSFAKDSHGKPYAVLETVDDSEPNIKHLYIRADSPSLAANVSNRPDGGYDTNDLFLEHPDHPGYYTYLHRRDDTLVLVNGEKTNPIPMESTIRECPVVKEVLVLGQGRQCTAALIELNLEYTSKMTGQEINSSVREAVDEANKNSPNYAVIVPQMIWILPPNQTLPSTDKGTVMRKKAIAENADAIEKLYNDFIEGPSDITHDVSDVSIWSEEKIEKYLVKCVANILQIPISRLDDRSQCVFDLGLNSLSAIQLRNLIIKHFSHISQDFLYENRNIAQMREALVTRRNQSNAEINNRHYEDSQKITLAYMQKLDADFPVAHTCYDEKKKTVVLLTGATGFFGSFLLRDMLKDDRVAKIYCCVRGDKEKLHTRLVDTFKSHSLDTSLLDTDRLETLPMNFKDPFLGFTEERYQQLKEEVTVIQHCGWLLNFKMGVDYFDQECIAPFYNLLKFAYREVNPMHVHFISSIAASSSYGDEVFEEPLPLDSHVALPVGYAQSKFVVESIFNHLTIKKNFPCYIERLGQICGDSDNGVWKTSEFYPLAFIGGASVMRKMPDLNIAVDWIPVNAASATVVDIMLRTAYLPADKNQFIFGIINPRILAWSELLQAMRDCGMKFDTVPHAEWIETLLKDDSNPAYLLLSFYERYFNEMRIQTWKTEKTSAVTPLINKAPVLDAELFNKFLTYWKSIGFYVEEDQKV